MSRNTKEQYRSKFAASQQKTVYEFFDGTRDRKVDVWRFMLQIQEKIPLEMAAMNSASGKSASDLITAIREVLSIPTWTEESDAGLTDGQVLELFAGIANVANGEKKNTRPAATSQPSTALAS